MRPPSRAKGEAQLSEGTRPCPKSEAVFAPRPDTASSERKRTPAPFGRRNSRICRANPAAPNESPARVSPWYLYCTYPNRLTDQEISAYQNTNDGSLVPHPWLSCPRTRAG